MQGSSSGRATQGSFFEGLLILSLKAQGAFAEALRGCGFDPQQPKAIYPIEIWNSALEVAWHHCYPELERGPAYRQLGQQLARGFLRTWRGRVVDMGLPMLGADRLLEKVPELCALDTFHYQVKVTRLEPRHYRVLFREDPDAKPELMAGLLEEALRRARVVPRIGVEWHTERDFELDVTW